MRKSPVLVAAAFLGLGFAGLVGGHAASYAVAVPDVHDRAVLLAHTGHGYLPSAQWAAVMLGLAAVVAGIAAGYLCRPGSEAPRLRRVAPVLAAVQAGGFLVLELAERLASGASMATLRPGILAVGVVFQLAAALLIAVVVAGLRRVGELISAATSASSLPRLRPSWPVPNQARLRPLRLPRQVLARPPPRALVV